MSDQDRTPDGIVEGHWPYDGPHSEESVELAAKVIAGLVRYMNNALWSVRPCGPSLYRVLSALNGAVYGADQLLDQLRGAAVALAEDSTMYDDRRDRPAQRTARELAAELVDARQALADGPLRPIERAAGLACHLGHESRRPGRRGAGA
jgi:hypothetical protein